ncbi:ABC transporter ATP-binding protein (plasmid) [Paroceanicella profunda]|uniref:ABC transporter ATP-binding protein n=1 Tax=Paroceanicella profunda TaxID=2579971 RepID=A0A5B8FZK5_9RHOB|nr:ABC transporter ATP-binding protein [Paroceanicella profunda]QDL93895.1 ABC transporter ATP-binding protein [Paroceanicella profunda]
MSGPAPVSIDIWVKRFGAREVLRDIALTLAPGERVAVLGPSGVGKSTLLRIAAGLDTAFEGTVRGAGRVAMVFQEPTLLPWRSARDNLVLAARIPAAEAEAALASVGLAGRGEAFPGHLSLGQQRRLALARALCARPEFLVLDEPFASLDAETAAGMRALTARLVAECGATTLLVTHAPAEAEALADRILVMSGTPAQLRPRGRSSGER